MGKLRRITKSIDHPSRGWVPSLLWGLLVETPDAVGGLVEALKRQS